MNNMAVMKSTDFIKKLKEIEKLPTVYYSKSGGDWAKWNGKSWNFDCVILVKAILWGWNANKKAAHGGAKYGSNGVYDDNADQIIKRCKNVSTDFSNLTPGELLWMSGHVGVYIGDGKVIECTAAWTAEVLVSDINSKGKRSRNGKAVGSWKKHGRLPYIEYVVEEPKEEEKKEEEKKPAAETTLKFKVGDKIILNGYLYVDSQGNGKGAKKTNHKSSITKTANGSKPYHIGTLGWVAEADLTLQTTETKKEEPKTVYKTVTGCSSLNLRTSAKYGNNVYKAVKKGTKLEYLGMTSGWAKVKYDNKTLYCGPSYLK